MIVEIITYMMLVFAEVLLVPLLAWDCTLLIGLKKVKFSHTCC